MARRAAGVAARAARATAWLPATLHDVVSSLPARTCMARATARVLAAAQHAAARDAAREQRGRVAGDVLEDAMASGARPLCQRSARCEGVAQLRVARQTAAVAAGTDARARMRALELSAARDVGGQTAAPARAHLRLTDDHAARRTRRLPVTVLIAAVHSARQRSVASTKAEVGGRTGAAAVVGAPVLAARQPRPARSVAYEELLGLVLLQRRLPDVRAVPRAPGVA